MIHDIFNDTYLLLKRVGAGSFCELFVACNINRKNELVAIKVQKAGIQSDVMVWESKVLRHLSNLSTVPSHIHQSKHHYSHDTVDYMVMELLSGEDMSILRDRTRSAVGFIPIPVVSYLSTQMLRCIRDMHETGYIHRDIKPANFVRKSAKETQFCIVDFGIAKLYRREDRSIIPERASAQFRGTRNYASPHTHEFEDQCPRDDLFSLWFVWIDLLCGKLPWTEQVKKKEKDLAASIKKEFVSSPEKLLKWIKEILSANANFLACSGEGSIQRICEETMVMFDYLRGLRYADVPDYDLIERSITNIVDDPAELKAVGNFNYKVRGFDWSSGPDKLTDLRSVGGEIVTVGTGFKHTRLSKSFDIDLRQRLLYSKGKYLGSQVQKALVAARASLSTTAMKSAGDSLIPASPGVAAGSKREAEAEAGAAVDEPAVECRMSADGSGVLLLEGDPAESPFHTSSQRVEEEIPPSPPPVPMSPQRTSTTADGAIDGGRGDTSQSPIADMPPSSLSLQEGRPFSLSSGHVMFMDVELGFRWQALVEELLAIPESKLSKETMELYESVLRDAKRFYFCQLGADDAQWAHFEELQKTVHKFQLGRGKVSKRSRDFNSTGSHGQHQNHIRSDDSRKPDLKRARPTGDLP